MRTRLRESSPVDYQVERHNSEWSDHVARTLVTAGLGMWFLPDRIIDPACGDGSIALTMNRIKRLSHLRLADISEPNIRMLNNPTVARPPSYQADVADIMATLLSAAEEPKYDLCILSEILEHLPDPDTALRLARPVARWVLCSSPLILDGHDDNPEHLWAFDMNGYEEMLNATGWSPLARTTLAFKTFPYTFQVWIAE